MIHRSESRLRWLPILFAFPVFIVVQPMSSRHHAPYPFSHPLLVADGHPDQIALPRHALLRIFLAQTGNLLVHDAVGDVSGSVRRIDGNGFSVLAVPTVQPGDARWTCLAGTGAAIVPVGIAMMRGTSHGPVLESGRAQPFPAAQRPSSVQDGVDPVVMIVGRAASAQQLARPRSPPSQSGGPRIDALGRRRPAVPVGQVRVGQVRQMRQMDARRSAVVVVAVAVASRGRGRSDAAEHAQKSRTGSGRRRGADADMRRSRRLLVCMAATAAIVRWGRAWTILAPCTHPRRAGTGTGGSSSSTLACSHPRHLLVVDSGARSEERQGQSVGLFLEGGVGRGRLAHRLLWRRSINYRTATIWVPLNKRRIVAGTLLVGTNQRYSVSCGRANAKNLLETTIILGQA
mmetsp:Transcript_18246/g.52179  ORF Transcript_18246/g.52179 Transcript_18246/m.52179 type:complete len:402 (+) Transcript_18246:822-2027(+)